MKTRLGPAALWIVNIALLAALVDAAYETFAGGSPIRFVVTAVVAVYTVLCVALRGKGGVTVRAELSFTVLAALTAYSGWQLGALSAPNGLRMAGAPAGVAAAVEVAVLLAALIVALLFAARLPVGLRVLLALIAAYPLISLGGAVAHGTGLGEALRSNDPLPPGPFWLRGSFLAAAGVLPVAAVLSLVSAVVFALRKRGGTALRLGVAALALTLATQFCGLEAQQAGLPALALTSAGISTFSLGANPAATLPPAEVTQTSAAGTSGANEPGSSAIASVVPVELRMPGAADSRDAAATLPPPLKAVPAQPQEAASQMDAMTSSFRKQDYDVDAFADTLGPGVAPAFAFVRDDIRFDSYSGLLRGFRGTFTARAGNAIDRAVLLAHILNREGVHVRFAVGHLAQPQADRLYERIFEPVKSIVAASSAAVAANSDHGGLRDRVYARARRDYAVISAALGSADSSASIPTRAEVENEIATHMWLQASVNGAWVDLDTAFPDATQGHAYATVDTTYPDVPDDMEQHVTIRAVSESLLNGALKEDRALDLTLPAYELIDQQVFFGNAGPGMGGILGNKDAGTPVLWAAGEAHAGKSIAFATSPASSSPFGGAGGAFGGAAATAAPGAPVFVSESLEFVVDKPDGSKDVTRRILVDRADHTWRANPARDPAGLHDLARNADGIIAAQSVYNIWFTAGDHDLRNYADAVAALTHSVRAPDPAASPATMTFSEGVWPFALSNFVLPAFSDHVIVPSLNDSPQIRLYADSPRIFMFGISPEPGGKAGVVFDTDLRRDSLRGLARDPSQRAQVLAHKLWFGVLEGSLEHELGTAAAASAGSDPANSASTSNLLASSGVVVLRAGSNADSSATDKNTAAAIRSALASGDTLVVPKCVFEGGTAGWWQIARATGDTRAVLDETLNGYKVYDPVGSGSGEIPTWGNVGGKTVRLNGPYGPAGGAGKGGGGGGEPGEYVETTNMMAFTAGEIKMLGAGVAAFVGIIATLFEALK